jgi:hypothetical protein
VNETQTVMLGPQPAAANDGQTVVFATALICVLAGAASLSAGIYIVFGLGWSLISAAPLPLIFGITLWRGMTRG